VLKKMGMDLIGPLPKSKQGQIYALVMQDYFTKWPKAIPLKDATMAGAILLVISMWGPPAELLSNQGPEFVVELNCELSRQQGIKRQYATAYHPQTNGQVERFNRMLKAMTAKFVNGRQDNWDIYLPAFLYAYRTSLHKSTGHTPYKAMLGRAPPSEDRAATESIPMDEWVQELCIAREEARKLISANIESEKQDRVESTPHWSRTWEAGNLNPLLNILVEGRPPVVLQQLAKELVMAQVPTNWCVMCGAALTAALSVTWALPTATKCPWWLSYLGASECGRAHHFH